MKVSRFGSERSAVEITYHDEEFYTIEFYAKPQSQWERVNVPTVVLIGKQIAELKEFFT